MQRLNFESSMLSSASLTRKECISLVNTIDINIDECYVSAWAMPITRIQPSSKMTIALNKYMTSPQTQALYQI